MDQIVFKYRSREITEHDISHIKRIIKKHSEKGRSHISRILCQDWQWYQENGQLKECAARDLLLRLEERNLVKLPSRLRPKNNQKKRSYNQIPFYNNTCQNKPVTDYNDPEFHLVSSGDDYLWGFLLNHYHYLGCPKLVGKYLKYLVFLDGQPVACMAWASAAFKVKSRDDYIGWSTNTRKNKLHLVVNNTRFLVLPWIRIQNLASRILSSSLKRISADWESIHHHPLYLAETFVDLSRFHGTCYKAANWHYIGQTKGSAKKGNTYHRHGQTKAVYLYPLDRQFKRKLADDQG